MATRNIVPRATGEASIGTALKKWATGFFSGALHVGNIAAESVSTEDWYAGDPRAILDYYPTQSARICISGGASSSYVPLEVYVGGFKRAQFNADGSVYWYGINRFPQNGVKIAGSNAGFTILTSEISDTGDHTVAFPAATGTVVLQTDAIPSPGAFGEETPNTVRSLNKEVYKTASADSPLTAAECSGTIVSNYGMTDADCVISLPTAAAGLGFLLILPAVRARYFKLRAGANDKIYLSGTSGIDNGYVGVASGYGSGACCSVFTFTTGAGAYDWSIITIVGTWVAS